MARFEFKLPDIGEGVTEGEIVKWLVGPNEIVKEDQPMVEVMTDKATVTITSPKAGKIVETRGKEGQIVAVHSVLVVFDLDAAGPVTAAHTLAPTAPTAAPKNDGPAATAVGDIREDLPGMNLMPKAAAPPQVPIAVLAPIVPTYFNEKPLATPATRKLARDLGIDLRRVQPTGPHGRVTKDDIRTNAAACLPGPISAPPSTIAAPIETPAPMAMAVPPVGPAPTPAAAPAAAPAPPPVPTAPKALAPIKVPPPPKGEEALEERVPLKGVRKRIFEQMGRSKQTAAHFTFVEECDVTALKELRARLKPSADKAGVKLSFLPFFVKAVVSALKKHPSLNSAFDESTQEIVTRKYYDIGIASATEAGLMVPVVRRADRKSILEIARDIQRLADDTKAGKVKSEDLGGSTFTITSLGAQGGLFATPILNFPEVAILGIHQMKQKPVVRDGQIVIGDLMLMSLSFDHRIIDGHIGAAFAYEIIGYLENPDRLFLEMT